MTTVVFAHSCEGVVDAKTCFWVPLMKLAKGSTSDVGQLLTQ